jgi:2'-5' RNA ligase
VEHASHEPLSLWLVPADAERETLAGLIRELAGREGTPAFEPHLTLLGGLRLAAEDARARADHLRRGLRALRLSFRGLAWTDDYYRCLFAEVERTEELQAARDAAERAFAARPDERFVPHLSLLYAHLPAERKQALAAEVWPRLGGGFTSRALVLTATGGDPPAWRALVRHALV